MACEAAVLLHAGSTTHARHTPFRHRFRYRMWMLSVDLDRLDGDASAVLAHNRFGLLSLHDRDHGPRDGSSLLGWTRKQLAAEGLERFGAHVRMMVIPRVLGWAFNPIAFYFCRDAEGRLGAVLHQVKNTFGDQHGYLLPIVPPAEEGDRVRQQADKKLHVSPFFDRAGGYRFAFHAPRFAPGEGFNLLLTYGAQNAPRLTATLNLRTSKASWGLLLGELIRQPMMPVKLYAAIHWQALRLWVRGAVFHPAPAPPVETVSGGAARPPSDPAKAFCQS